MFTFIGSLIGAGFATGREIALFFGACGIAAPVIAGLFCGIFSFLFLEIGRKNPQITPMLFPKTHRFFGWLISVANAAIFCAMIAGAESIVYDTFSVHGGGFLSALICLAVSAHGKNGIQWLNTAVVPLLIVLIFLLIFKSKPVFLPGISVTRPMLYAALNILSGGVLVGGMAGENTRKDNVVISCGLGIVLSVLLGGVYAAVISRANTPMPLFELAKDAGLPISGGILIYFAILTTMAGSLSVASGNSLEKGVWITAIGFLISFFGFQPLVDATYPVIGGLGILLTSACAYRLVALKIDYKTPVVKQPFPNRPAMPRPDGKTKKFRLPRFAFLPVANRKKKSARS